MKKQEKCKERPKSAGGTTSNYFSTAQFERNRVNSYRKLLWHPERPRPCSAGPEFLRGGGVETSQEGCWPRRGVFFATSDYAVWSKSFLERQRCCSCSCRPNRIERESFGRWISDNDLQEKNKSVGDLSKTSLGEKKDFIKFKRSLKLLGFELCDFGLEQNNMEMEITKRCQSSFSSNRSATFCRSISLDFLRQEIREAWSQDSLGIAHRKLLAQAAFEQWCLKKNNDHFKKKEKEKEKRRYAKEILERETEEKKKKAEEEFQKWLGKKRKKPENESPTKNLGLNPEHAEMAFLKWKKEKDKEFRKKIKRMKEKEEEKMKLEIQKKEKQKEAEKAFRLWKKNQEQKEILQAKKKKKTESKQDERKAKEESQISFQIWKATKDEETKFKIKTLRKTTEMERIKRLAESKEREQAAQQAFEEWLEQLEQRKFSTNMHRNRVPWIPV